MVKLTKYHLNNCPLQICSDKCIISGKTYLLVIALCHYYEKFDINNILLLNIETHAFFDAFLVSINPTTSKVVVKESCPDKQLFEHNGKYIDKLPKQTLKYLEFHYKKFLESN